MIKSIIIKFFGLFSVVRGYNILIIVTAQYLTSIYILSKDTPLRLVILDINLFVLVLASALSIAGGYIINNFYDSEKDLINRPIKSNIDRLVSQNTKLSFYFILNFLSIIFASYVSFKAVLFFSIYIFSLWLYSHKLKKIVYIGNLASTLLTITPFFILYVYYKNFEFVIFIHAIFLFLILLMRELTKDLENLKGDLTLHYKTIAVTYGEHVSKCILSVLSIITMIPIYILLYQFSLGCMFIFFYLSIGLIVIFSILLWVFESKKQYIILHNILKGIIIAGVFSVLLIDCKV